MQEEAEKKDIRAEAAASGLLPEERKDLPAEAAGGPLPVVKKTIAQHRKASFYIKKYCMIFLGSIIASLGLELFLIPNRVIDGGVVGISIMMSTITQLPFGLFLVLLNLPFLYLGYKQIGKNFAIATTIAICFLSGWSAVFEPIRQVTEDPFLAAIFGGIIDGLGVGLIIRAGGSLDGTEIVAIIMDRRSVFSVGEVVMFINLFILSSAGLLYGWDKAMYSLVAYFVISKMIDVVIKGLDESYAVMIVTNEHHLGAQRPPRPRCHAAARCGRLHGRKQGSALLRRHAPRGRQAEGDRARKGRERVRDHQRRP